MSDAAQAIENAVPQAGVDVRLENFEGPLDLLLYLIKKNDLEISDIPIAQITQEYLAYLDLMKDLNLETAGEFLVMASMLMQIKAQMLLPVPDAEQEEGPDPRTELMNKLLEYQQFKEAAGVLAGQHERAKDVFYRDHVPTFGDDDYMLKASVFDLMNAFKKILDQAPREVGQILRDEVPLEVKIREVLNFVTERTSATFEELFAGGRRRIDLIVTFMAVLELIRTKQVVARQAEIFGSIRIYRSDAAPTTEPAAETVIIEEMPAPAPASPIEQAAEAAVIEETVEDVASLSLDDLVKPMEPEDESAEPVAAANATEEMVAETQGAETEPASAPEPDSTHLSDEKPEELR